MPYAEAAALLIAVLLMMQHLLTFACRSPFHSSAAAACTPAHPASTTQLSTFGFSHYVYSNFPGSFHNDLLRLCEVAELQAVTGVYRHPYVWLLDSSYSSAAAAKAALQPL